MKKMTKREKFEMLKAIPAVAENTLLVEFIDHELELLAKKNASSADGERKLTEKQKANETLKVAILEGMADNRLYTITELIKEIPACAELTNQKVSAVIRQMYESANPTIEKMVDKRKSYFRKIAE